MANAKNANIEEEEEAEESHSKWINIIYIPFHFAMRTLVLLVVVVKCIMGPLSSVYKFIKCERDTRVYSSTFYSALLYFYSFFCDPIYLTDTFLHVIHRQVKEEAVRREYLPKSAFLILIDFISVIPILDVIVENTCSTPHFWPNILAFHEMLTIYRVVQFFELGHTHSVLNLVVGYLILTALLVNALTCILLLITFSESGLCLRCNLDDGVYDWRSFISLRIPANETNNFHYHFYGSCLMLSYLMNKLFDEIRPKTMLELRIAILYLFVGYFIQTAIIVPKMFAEGIFRIRGLMNFNYRVKRIIEETKIRNSNPQSCKDVANFYSLMWEKRQGTTSIPDIMNEFPTYLGHDIKMDLVWPVFHHSPTLRRTSPSYKKWLSDFIRLEYKLPRERFFSGPRCFSNLYYIKSGIVQLFSEDDSVSPILSVTSGTLLGDISFLLPPLHRKIIVRCLTYCEVFVVSRKAILNSLHKFPNDRHNIIKLAKERIKHARTLYACKQQVRGVDRADDEGVAWIKRRWWEIANSIESHKMNRSKKIQIPPEEHYYHCAKYIGQLVICTERQLQKKSMFIKTYFPWVLAPRTQFGFFWERLMTFTVWIVLISYPPCLTTLALDVPLEWFSYLHYAVNLVFILDIVVLLLTARDHLGVLTVSAPELIFLRFKNPFFVLDILAASWMEYFVIAIGKPQYFYAVQFNRLLKVYMLFFSRYKNNWTSNNNPLVRTFYLVCLSHFIYFYVSGFFIFICTIITPDLSVPYFYGAICATEGKKKPCQPEELGIFTIVFEYTFESLFPSEPGNTITDNIVKAGLTILHFFVQISTKCLLLPVVYLKYRYIVNYQYFVYNLRKHFKYHNIHPDLMVRLNRYLVCQWKYYNGMDIMHATTLHDEPYDIYWKMQGELAEKIIAECGVFNLADPRLIRDLANKTKILLIPKDSTLLLFGVELPLVAFLIKGSILSTYEDEDGKSVSKFIKTGRLISTTAVFIGRLSLRCYTASTDCEILYIKKEDLFNTLKLYPEEVAYIEQTEKELNSTFQEVYYDAMTKHNKFLDRQPKFTASGHKWSVLEIVHKYTLWPAKMWNNLGQALQDYRRNPESKFIRHWMCFRIIIVFCSIICSSLQGGSGAIYKKQLSIFTFFCDVVGFIDICIKLFMPYYKKNGLIISAPKMCMCHYMSRGFLLDVVGTFPVYRFLAEAVEHVTNENTKFFCQTLCKMAHLYLIMGWFSYKADSPTMNAAYLTILKWQVLIVILMFGASHYYMIKCVQFKWDENYNLNITKLPTCWMPNLSGLSDYPSVYELHLVFAKSLSITQCSFLRNQVGRWQVVVDHFSSLIFYLALGCIFWYFSIYSQTLLVLSYRGNVLFSHGLHELRSFLNSERLEKELIDRVVAHFNNWWRRTHGISVASLMTERIGVIFRQDLSYYFYERTLSSANSLLLGKKAVERSLASHLHHLYFLPGEDIVREMDLVPFVYFVHRGKVTLYKEGLKIAILSKGCIFGQIKNPKPRPIRITAVAEECVDVLMVSSKEFFDVIDYEIKKNIEDSDLCDNDYILAELGLELPSDNIEYLLRGGKVLHIPFRFSCLKKYTDGYIQVEQSTAYASWLYFCLFINPCSTAILVLLLGIVDQHTIFAFGIILRLLDLIHLIHIVLDFFTVELRVIGNKCVYRYTPYKKLYSAPFILDVISFFFVIVGSITHDWRFFLGRLLRLFNVTVFYKQFCNDFRVKYIPILVKLLMVLLLLHALTCGWIYVACKSSHVPQNPEMPHYFKKNIDSSVWLDPSARQGCLSTTPTFVRANGTREVAYLVPSHWQHDYVVAFLYITITLTRTNMDQVFAITLEQVYYRVFITIILYLLDLWICSMAISAIYTKLRHLYLYDYQVAKLVNYLRLNGLCESLLDAVIKYTKQLWQRQEGCWLPELTFKAPHCLRQDIMQSLYVYHLRTAPVFQELPHFFLRQLSMRLTRVVIYPGKHIVREGDINPILYFIHEGEVEKWYIDSRGNQILSTVLTINGIFGLIPGLFPNETFKYSYYTRTVVDLVTLKHKDWQDLLLGYPDIKEKLYASALKFKREAAVKD